MKILKAFYGDKKIKDKYVARVKKHYELDEIIKGKYWENGKGCAVGCTVEKSHNAHDAFQEELGISWRIALVEDSIFENLQNGEAKKFPLQFLEAVKVGSDTELVFKKFVIWVLGDKKDGLVNVVDEKQKDLLNRILKLYKKSLKTEIKQSEWKVLADEAASASAYAYTYASASAYTYTYTYASASASASASAYASAYAYASASASAYASASGTFNQDVFDKRIVAMRDKLLALLRKAK